MKKVVIAAAVIAGLMGGAGAALADDPQLCITAHVDVNGTTQDVNQCLPQ